MKLPFHPQGGGLAKSPHFLLLLLLLISTLGVHAQTTSTEAVKKVTATNNITEDLDIGSGRTFTVESGAGATIASGATFTYTAGAIFAGSASEFMGDLGFSAFFQTLVDDTTAAAAKSTLGAASLTGGNTFTGVQDIDDTTDSTSGTTGSIHTDGGLGVVKKVFFADTTASTSSTTGSLIVSGGVGIAKDSYVNGLLFGRGAGNVSTNVAIGISPLEDSNGSSGNNVAIGNLAGSNLTSGTGNVMIGAEAGRVTFGSADVTTATNGLYLGYHASPGSASATNEIVIGNAGGLGSNTIVTGNSSHTHRQDWGKGNARGYLYGLRLSNNVSDATNDIDIAEGEARDSTGICTMYIDSGLTKRLDAAWSAGTGNGGLDQGSIANATYHVHLIGDGRTTTDVIYSLSHDRKDTCTMTIASPCVVTMGSTNRGHGLVAGSPFMFVSNGDTLPTGVLAGTQYYVIATGLTETTFQFSTTNGGSAVNSSGSQSGTHICQPGPQMPGGYTYFRRIGSIVRASAAILPFRQEGDLFMLVTTVLDVSVTNLSTSRVVNTAASAPTGIIVGLLGRIATTNASPAAVLCTPLIETDAAPVTTAAAPGATISMSPTFVYTLELEVLSNAAAQFATRASASSTTFRWLTRGWRDTRGRDAP